jgi:hypothetical protein
VVGGLTAPGRYDYLLRAETPGHETATGKVQTGKESYATIVLAPLAQHDASPGGCPVLEIADDGPLPMAWLLSMTGAVEFELPLARGSKIPSLRPFVILKHRIEIPVVSNRCLAAGSSLASAP